MTIIKTEQNNNQQQPNSNQGASTTNTTAKTHQYYRTSGHPIHTRPQLKVSKISVVSMGIQVHFKGNTTIKQLLMKPKDQDPKEKKSGVIYSYQCTNITCDEEYIEETARTLGERCKEHLKHPSPIHAHIQLTGHTIEDSSFSTIDREDQGQARTFKGIKLHQGK